MQLSLSAFSRSGWTGCTLVVLALPFVAPSFALRAQTNLPAPSGTPLSIDVDNDPILALGRKSGGRDGFVRAIATAVERHPALTEAEAEIVEGQALRGQARAGLLPSADVTITSYKVIDRQFSSGGLQNVVERTRPNQQTDGLLSVNQLAFDGGATFKRISAANARIQAAVAGVDDAASRVALGMVGAWYDVFTYRELVNLAEQYRADQASRRGDLQARIDQGAAAVADLARIDNAVASVDTRLANFRRQLANAEARFAALTGTPPPPGLARAPALGVALPSVEAVRAAAADVPAVRAAQAQARAVRFDARASQADTYPVVGLSVDAGRYGVFETARDYDVRGRVTLRARLGGGIQARADQAEARSVAADARAATTLEEAGRDAVIAWSDIRALDEQLDALRASYIASRRSRDTIAERFRLTRGTLIDVLDANDTYFAAAASYIGTLAERDAAHYVLLSRTGRLLDALGLTPANETFRIR